MADSWFRKLLGPTDPSGRRRKEFVLPDPARPAAASRSNPYQAVGVVAGSRGCAAVARVLGTRFLARQAPRLPLADCDRSEQCHCRFEKYVDRRSLMQRSPYGNFGGVTFGGAEKRQNRGRRNTDR